MPGKKSRPNRNRRLFFSYAMGVKRSRVLWIETLEDRRCLAASSALPLDLSQLQLDPTSYDASSLIVRYREGAAQEAARVYGPSQTVQAVRIGFGLQRVELAPGVSVDSMLDQYRSNAQVMYAEPDYHLRIAMNPNDAQFDTQWDMHNTGQSGGTVDADIDAPEAWEVTTGSGSTVVAVIDTGVDYLHPDLAPNIWTNPGEVPGDGLDNDNNGYVDDVHGYDFFNDDADPIDDHNHGTHVAGTIGAEGNNGTGIAGVNWGAQIMALKFLGADGSGTTSAAIEAIQYAIDNGAHISNNSWGGDPYSQALFDVISDARDVGHIFVAASGNGNFIGFGIDNDAQPFYPASYDLDNIVAVAATDRDDRTAIFSNYGLTSVDIGAPGVDILSTTIGGYGLSSGTSMATPHVTGALSLVRDLDPSLSYQSLIDRVLLSADPVDSLQGITVTGGRLNLAASIIPDEIGPQVLDVQPSGLILDPFDSLEISFNEPIDANTLTLGDFRFSGPEGDVGGLSLSAVAGSSNRKFELSFPTQSAAGEYELIISPGILDRFGNWMDQNDNGTGGEVPGDESTHALVKVDAVARYDFGTTTSPVAANYTPVTGGDHYSAAVGHGWQQGAVHSLERGGDPLTADFNYTTDATFAVDLPNAEYDVIVTLGESIVPHDQMGVFLEGVQVDSVSTAAGQFAVNTYRTSVTDGQLSLAVRDLGGSDPWVMINGVDIVFAGPDLTGPTIMSTTASGDLTGPLDRISVTFSESIPTGSFTADDATLEGPAGEIIPIAVDQVAAGGFEITFEPQNSSGSFRLEVGPDITDVAGNLMDQDGDGVGGETVDDLFETLFTLEAGPEFVAGYDFGTTLSPVADGYTQVTGATQYSQSAGYGWESGPVFSINRSGNAVTQDLNYTTDASFAVDVPNGEYDVTVTQGEALIRHEQMGIFLEGVQVDTVSTAAFEYAVNTYRISISDGQLNLRVRDLGGSNPWAVINGLDILFVGPDLTGPSVTSTDVEGIVAGPIDRITVSFSEPIDAATFDLQDITVAGPAGAITPIAVVPLTAGDFEITFDPQNDEGQYHLVLGPDIADAAGNLMDQDSDGTSGESLDDQFEVTFTIEAGPQQIANLDFGTTLSPVAADYTRVTGNDLYDASVGHGWLPGAGAVHSLSRGGDALTRDFIYTADATFVYDLADGDYEITVIMGEAFFISHDQMGVYLEGTLVDTVSAPMFQFVTNTYNVQVNDGQLTLRLRDLGGSNPWAIINGLEIARVAGSGQSAASVGSTPQLLPLSIPITTQHESADSTHSGPLAELVTRFPGKLSHKGRTRIPTVLRNRLHDQVITALRSSELLPIDVALEDESLEFALHGVAGS